MYLVSHLARVHMSVSPTPSNPILHAGQKLVHVGQICKILNSRQNSRCFRPSPNFSADFSVDLFHPEGLFRSGRDGACTLVVEVVDGKAEDEIANKVNKTRDKNCVLLLGGCHGGR